MRVMQFTCVQRDIKLNLKSQDVDIYTYFEVLSHASNKNAQTKRQHKQAFAYKC